MAIQSQIQELASSTVQKVLGNIQQRAEAELADAEERRVQRRIAFEVRQLREKEQAKKTRRVHVRRLARARMGLAALFELSRLPEIQKLAMLIPRYQPLDADDPGFQYYYAGDDQEYSQVILYPDQVMVDFGGASPNCTGNVRFLATDTSEQLNEGLEQIASFGRFKPLFAADLFGAEKGFSPDLDALAYQVLIDAANPRLLPTYFKRAIENIAK